MSLSNGKRNQQERSNTTLKTWQADNPGSSIFVRLRKHKGPTTPFFALAMSFFYTPAISPHQGSCPRPHSTAETSHCLFQRISLLRGKSATALRMIAAMSNARASGSPVSLRRGSACRALQQPSWRGPAV
jgi:hypothetical protein